MNFRLHRVREPSLLFGHGQALEDPRDGLTLFGPFDKGSTYGIRWGLIGTEDGCRRFLKWVDRIQKPMWNDPPQIARPAFPGFEAAFGVPWNPRPLIQQCVDPAAIETAVHMGDPYQRVYATVNLFAKPIVDTLKEEEGKPDVWFVVIPDIVHKFCRPESTVIKVERVAATNRMNYRSAQKVDREPFLFTSEADAAIPYQFEINFHNQLKGRLLEHNCPTQIIRESTIAHTEILNKAGFPTRRLDKMQSAIAWNIATAAFYKCGARPWKLDGIRPGVCYVGLVFKRDDRQSDPQSACCAAQMFLDSGDGVVFKGNVGPWYTPGTGDFHLSFNAASELIWQAISAYKKLHNNKPPNELFIHGKVRFDDMEWKGFEESVPVETELVGVRIRPETNLKLFRKGDQPILRGLSFIRDNRTAFLWTKGFIPRLQTYPGREVPNPILVDVCKGYADIETVLSDVLALTKLNYNTCIYGDGEPVTLRFADAVGEILTSGPIKGDKPLPFKHYI